VELYTPMPGDFLLTDIDGWVGKGVAVGQFILGDSSPFEHAALVISPTEVVEAMPGGAIISPISKYLGPERTHRALFVRPPLQPWQQVLAGNEGRQLEGTPYSFLDYLSIALAHLRIRPQFIVDRVATSKHLICSQLVDYVLRQVDFQLFDDGRFHGDVTPGDLYILTHAKPWPKHQEPLPEKL
jgi:hypothetical protein